MIKNLDYIATSLSDKSGLVNFYIQSETVLKNGDTEYFGIVHVGKYRSWCYFSQNQLKNFELSFPLQHLKTPVTVRSLFPSQIGFHVNKKTALDNKFYFNGAILFLLVPTEESERQKWIMDNRYKKWLEFKKNYGFLSVMFNDKQEIFYGKEVAWSYRKAANFRFPLFNCSFTKRLMHCASLQEMISVLLGDVKKPHLKTIKKHVAENIVSKEYDYYEVNFYYLSMIRLVNDVFGPEYLAELMRKNKISTLLKNRVFDNYSGSFLTEGGSVSKLTQLLKGLRERDEEWAKKVLLKWDLPLEDKYTDNFLTYLDTLKKEGVEFQLNRYPSLFYTFNMASKEYSKLQALNFVLKNESYSRLSVKFPKKILGYEIEVAKDYKTLIQWGAYLHNCAGNFEQQETYTSTISLGFIKDGKIEYLATIRRGEFTQLKGFKNSSPPKELYEATLKLLTESKNISEDSARFTSYSSCCIQRDIYQE